MQVPLHALWKIFHVLKLTRRELDADTFSAVSTSSPPFRLSSKWVGMALAELAETRSLDDRGHRENKINHFVMCLSYILKTYQKTYFLEQK